MSAPVNLAPDSIAAIAERVAELLRGEPTGPDLIDAAEIARRFGVSRDYIYAHAVELGAIRMGTGPKARLRFDLARVVDALSPQPHPASSRPPRAQRRPPVELLPIGPDR